MLFVPEDCNKFAGTEAEGVNVIFPEDTEYPAVKAVPPTVTPVIAPLQVASSVKVTSNGASTVAFAAVVKVGAVKPGANVVEKSSI
jgi:hypothetical protein